MKTKKGFTMLEMISVIALLGIIIVIVATKGFGAFNNIKEIISVENENTIKEAANFLMTEVKSCEGNEDIYKNLFDEYLNIAEKNNEPCDKLIDKATKKNDNEGCLDIDLSYLIDKNYINSEGVIEINDKYESYVIKGCLEGTKKKVKVDLPKQEDLIRKLPTVTYHGETEFIQMKKTLDLNLLHENITCKLGDKECSNLKVKVYDKYNVEVVYYEAEFNEFNGEKLSLNNSNIMYGKQIDKILGNKEEEQGVFILEIVAKDADGFGTNKITFNDAGNKKVEKEKIEFNVYSVEPYKPIIDYKFLDNFVYDPINYYGDNLFAEEIFYQIDMGNITCKDGLDKTTDCESLKYKIKDSNGKIVYERSYIYHGAGSELNVGLESLHLGPDKYTLELIGIDKDGVEGNFIHDLLVSEYPYDYTLNFYGSYYFEDNLIDTGQIYIECFNKDGTACNDVFYNIYYNDGSYIDNGIPYQSKTIHAKEGYYDLYIYAIDGYGKATEQIIENAFYVYSPCGEYVEECHVEYYDTSYTDYYCYDYEMCDSYPMTWCDWDNCTGVCCWDSWDTYCWTETYCEPYYVYDYEEINVCEDVWYPKSCVG